MSDIGKTLLADHGGILPSVRARKRVPEATGVLHCTGGSRCVPLYSSRRGLWARPGIFFSLTSRFRDSTGSGTELSVAQVSSRRVLVLTRTDPVG
jgi:hypothetical protein